MLMKILGGLPIVSNICWLSLFGWSTKTGGSIQQSERAQQQRDTCQSQVGKLTDTMSKLCACGK